MGLGQDALARQSSASPGPDLPTAPQLTIVPRRPARRNRAVTILKVPRFWPSLQLGRSSSKAGDPLMASKMSPAVGLDAFGSESTPAAAVVAAPAAPSRYAADVWLPVALKWFAVILLSAGIAVAAVFGYQRRIARTTGATGSVTVETAPVGLAVTMDGKLLGNTPLTTVLTPGAYKLQVGTVPNVRIINVNVTAGSSNRSTCRIRQPGADRQLERWRAASADRAHSPSRARRWTAARSIAGGARQSRAGRSSDRGPHQRWRRQACGVDPAS